MQCVACEPSPRGSRVGRVVSQRAVRVMRGQRAVDLRGVHDPIAPWLRRASSLTSARWSHSASPGAAVGASGGSGCAKSHPQSMKPTTTPRPVAGSSAGRRSSCHCGSSAPSGLPGAREARLLGRAQQRCLRIQHGRVRFGRERLRRLHAEHRFLGADRQNRSPAHACVATSPKTEDDLQGARWRVWVGEPYEDRDLVLVLALLE